MRAEHLSVTEEIPGLSCNSLKAQRDPMLTAAGRGQGLTSMLTLVLEQSGFVARFLAVACRTHNPPATRGDCAVGRDPSLPATVCERRWVSGQELLFDARRVTTIGFSEGRATH